MQYKTKIGAAISQEVQETGPEVEELVSAIRRACIFPGTITAKRTLDAMLKLEKMRVKPSPAWADIISAPGVHWRLMFTAAAKDVVAAQKKPGAGSVTSFPLAACQKFDGREGSFENGVFLGNLAHLTFKGPMALDGRRLSFDVDKMYIGLGPWRACVPLKAERDLAALDAKERGKLPFFLYAYVDDGLIVGRGRSGGLAVWMRADSEWAARAGVLQVYG
eukprot:CAMPEP_0202865678 /NCGR_PEP_ID=MMETSP1391-20130828/6293_1 /ASSEMBLY_ACC=CAM_ASM_000867 /TAXON_ID=1034604 /ORGANISM="Chlamydomonas leiostraca, Strain SAG 11-49" /LENGTH=219 /DNA_ID=CAMNT_0049545543 /DNA_START=103 /DNA_END=763 /DNA_ORIENTATION=-